MAFPTTGVLDTFTSADGSLGATANWTDDLYGAADTNAIRIVSNQIRNSGNTTYGASWYDAATFGPDCEVYIDNVTLQAAGNVFAIYLRLQAPGTAGFDGYLAQVVEGAPDQWSIQRVTNTAATILGAAVGLDLVAGDSIGLEAIGTTLTMYRKNAGSWASVLSRTDATYGSAGNIGILIQDNTTGFWDNFGGGTVVAASGVSVAWFTA